MLAETIISELHALRGNDEKRRILASFFKTGKGQYGEGDVMIGVTVPNTRTIAKKYANTPLETVGILMRSKYHEARFCALLIMVEQYKKASCGNDATLTAIAQKKNIRLLPAKR